MAKNMLSSGDLICGRFRIHSLLGKGGFAEVYRAFDLEQSDVVALKLLRQDLEGSDTAKERFVREAKILLQLEHPHIIGVREVGTHLDNPFISMEFVHGYPLDELLAKDALTPRAVLSLLVGIGHALDYAHTKGVLHRDLKPGNILVTRAQDDSLEAILIDFGIVKIMEGVNAVSTKGMTRSLTANMGLVGTPQYVSPEQIKKKTLTGACDRYALAIVVYEVLFGERPFDRLSVMDTLRAQLKDEPDYPTHMRDGTALLPTTRQALAQGLAKEPEDRLEHGAEFIGTLLATLPEETPLPPARPKLSGYFEENISAWKRSPIVMVGGAILLSSLLLLSIWKTTATTEPPRPAPTASAPVSAPDRTLSTLEKRNHETEYTLHRSVREVIEATHSPPSIARPQTLQKAQRKAVSSPAEPAPNIQTVTPSAPTKVEQFLD